MTPLFINLLKLNYLTYLHNKDLISRFCEQSKQVLILSELIIAKNTCSVNIAHNAYINKNPAWLSRFL